MPNGLGTGWWTYIRYNEERDRPKISWALLRRVWGYARPYRLQGLGAVSDHLYHYRLKPDSSFALSRSHRLCHHERIQPASTGWPWA